MKGKHPFGKASMNTLLMIPAAFLLLLLMWGPIAIVSVLDAKKQHRDSLAYLKSLEGKSEHPYRGDLFRENGR